MRNSTSAASIIRFVSYFMCIRLLGHSVQLSAQSPNHSIVGNWQGTISFRGQNFPTIFHVKDSAGTLQVTMDSPNQGAFGLPCQDIIFKSDSFNFNYKKVIFYKGKLENKDSISGTTIQRGFTIPLNLTKFIAQRPQTPKPPFPYLTRDVIYNSPDKKLQYGATITMPDNTGKFPAILLITGSGQQNRDEEIFKHQPFAVLADFLTRAGYLVMRVDDRGIGKSTGDFKGSTTFDFATDAENSLNYLKTLPQTDKKRVGLLGHSEGGIIAEMLASKRKDLDFIILMAAPGISSFHLQELQRMAGKRKIAPNTSAEALRFDSTVFHYSVAEFLTHKDTAAAHSIAIDRLKVFFKSHPTTLFTSAQQRMVHAEKSVPVIIKIVSSNPWMKEWLHMDAKNYLSKIKCKVLALNGSEDFQVTPKENLAGIKAALTAGPCTDFEIKELPGLNHLFQHCNICTLGEYETLEQTLDPSFLNAVKDWLYLKVPVKK